jgi:hypothetical protein
MGTSGLTLFTRCATCGVFDSRFASVGGIGIVYRCRWFESSTFNRPDLVLDISHLGVISISLTFIEGLGFEHVTTGTVGTGGEHVTILHVGAHLVAASTSFELSFT